MLQNIRCKIRDFHCVSITFSQQPEIIKFPWQHEAPEFLPVCQSVIKIDVLGHIAHNGIRTFTEAVL